MIWPWLTTAIQTRAVSVTAMFGVHAQPVWMRIPERKLCLQSLIEWPWLQWCGDVGILQVQCLITIYHGLWSVPQVHLWVEHNILWLAEKAGPNIPWGTDLKNTVCNVLIKSWFPTNKRAKNAVRWHSRSLAAFCPLGCTQSTWCIH